MSLSMERHSESLKATGTRYPGKSEIGGIAIALSADEFRNSCYEACSAHILCLRLAAASIERIKNR